MKMPHQQLNQIKAYSWGLTLKLDARLNINTLREKANPVLIYDDSDLPNPLPNDSIFGVMEGADVFFYKHRSIAISNKMFKEFIEKMNSDIRKVIPTGPIWIEWKRSDKTKLPPCVSECLPRVNAYPAGASLDIAQGEQHDHIVYEAIDELRKYGASLKNADSETTSLKYKAGDLAERSADKLKRALDADKLNSSQTFKTELKHVYNEMGQYRRMGFFHTILHNIAQAFSRCFLQNQSGVALAIGGVESTFFNQTTRQKLVENVSKALNQTYPSHPE